MPERAEHHWLRILPPVLLCAVLWGSAFPGIKLAYLEWEQQGLSIGLAEMYWFAGLRFTLAGGVLLLLSRQALRDFRATPIKLTLAFAATQTIGQYLFFYLGLNLSSGSLGSLMVATGSFWWMLLAPLILRTPWPSRGQWAALFLGAVGVSLATSTPADGRPFSLPGLLCLLTATLMGALGIITFSKIRPTMGPRAATGFSLFLGGLVLLAAGSPAAPQSAEILTPKVLALTLWLAFVSAFAFTLWNHLSTQHPVNLLASYRFLIPICGVSESLLLIPGEKATWGLLVGGTLVILSLLAAQRLSPTGPPKPASCTPRTSTGSRE
ncbi:DMT family transporter [Roseibacillus ishigakijimensis]|uniref:DMT family transporter n=1 Tax=Roseibacillus ishigakijimensis TaxID=454146 RepID=A0A934VKJ3_9BACT|nr:DMT family transporter [Roseibacillus ishigakijimensis]MBK1833704.1 DMT family transporter [Roseibacillus ishigakijimensis]